MKLYQIEINYSDMKRAAYTPLDYEVYGVLLTKKDLDAMYVQADDMVNDYAKRNRIPDIGQIFWVLDTIDVEPVYFKDNERLPLDGNALANIYRDYRSMRKAIEAGALKEVAE